jgi:hypothetical protein
MKQSRFFSGILALALIFGLMFAACPSPTGDPGNGDLDKTGLDASIAAAKDALAGAAVASNAADVPQGTQWVTSQVKTDFEAAIAAAELAGTTAKNQAAIDSAKTTLDTAIASFNAAKKPGSGPSVNKSALTAKIAEAENTRSGVEKSAGGADVAQGTKWITQNAWDTFESAINAAKSAQSGAASQAAVDAAVSALNGAITAFNNAKADGTKTSGFTTAEMSALITRAKAAKEGVTPAATGDDVGSGAYWASQSAFDTLNTAINSAEAATDTNRDSLFLALSQALTAFTAAKKPGSIPDKESLLSAISAADSAKSGVVEAAGKAEAPAGSKWATASQLAALKAAYDSAVAVASNASASKNQVAEETGKLNAATGVFNSAVSANGPGEGGGGDQKIGEITGTITLTGIPAQKPNVFIEVRNEESKWQPNGNKIDLSGINGSGNVSWSIPLYEEDAFTGPIEGAFTLWVGNGEDSNGYIIWIDQTKQLTGTTANVGDLGSASLAARTLSGTISVTYNGNPVPKVRIFADTFDPDYIWFGHFFLENPGPNTPWVLPIPVLSSQNYLRIHVEGFDNNGDLLFEHFNVKELWNVQQTEITKVNINITESAPSLEGKLHGTVAFTNLPNPPPHEVYIEAAYGSNSSGWTPISEGKQFESNIEGATVNWAIPFASMPADQQFLDALAAAPSLEVRLRLHIKFTENDYPMFIAEITKTVTNGNLEVDLGTVALPPTLLLSGTFSGTYEGGPIPSVVIRAHTSDFSVQQFFGLPYSASGTSWQSRLPYLESAQAVFFEVMGYDFDNNLVLIKNLNPSQTANVYQSDIAGITLDVGTTPPAAGNWINGTITTASGMDAYTINVTAGQMYYVWWNDSSEGDNSKTLDVQVSAIDMSGTELFSNVDSAWNTPQQFTAANDGKVGIVIQPKSSGETGTYSIAYNTTGVRP